MQPEDIDKTLELTNEIIEWVILYESPWELSCKVHASRRVGKRRCIRYFRCHNHANRLASSSTGEEKTTEWQTSLALAHTNIVYHILLYQNRFVPRSLVATFISWTFVVDLKNRLIRIANVASSGITTHWWVYRRGGTNEKNVRIIDQGFSSFISDVAIFRYYSIDCAVTTGYLGYLLLTKELFLLMLQGVVLRTNLHSILRKTSLFFFIPRSFHADTFINAFLYGP